MTPNLSPDEAHDGPDQEQILDLARRNVPEDVQSAMDLATAYLTPVELHYTVVTSSAGTIDVGPA